MNKTFSSLKKASLECRNASGCWTSSEYTQLLQKISQIKIKFWFTAEIFDYFFRLALHVNYYVIYLTLDHFRDQLNGKLP